MYAQIHYLQGSLLVPRIWMSNTNYNEMLLVPWQGEI